jgi:hypothetical protein
MSKERIKDKTKRKMPMDKAVKILSDYKRNNFNGYKTLIDNGYSEIYSKANSRFTLNAAKDKVDNALQLKDIGDVKDTANTLYDVIGLSKQDVLNELVKIIKQDINLAVKLRALEPFVKQEGINWVEKEHNQAQAVQIVLKEVDTSITVDQQPLNNPLNTPYNE